MSYTPEKKLPQNNLPFKTAYTAKPRETLTFAEDSPHTKQSFRDECDVNNIMNRYLSTGEMPVINQTAPQYLDVTGIEYQSAMEFVAGAQSLFQELPSNVRNRFGNDPGAFLDFCGEEKNRPEMAEMGLLRDEVALLYTQAPTPQNKTPTAPISPLPETAPQTGENPA